MVLGHVPWQRGDPLPETGPILCSTRLGELLRHYYRAA